MGVQLHKSASAYTLYVKRRDDSKAGAAVARKVCRLWVMDCLGQSCQIPAGSRWGSPLPALGAAGAGFPCIEALGSGEGLVLSLWGCKQVNQ